MITAADKRPWWWPRLANDAWVQEIRHKYSDLGEMDDKDIRDYFNDGWKYVTLWDDSQDARKEHEKLADAFLVRQAALAKAGGFMARVLSAKHYVFTHEEGEALLKEWEELL